jgi:UDP-N-acetylglucosamine--N-acetylmuramyl-(pentapeptide) pyrophosphoryl-undecaprenol N-acetylglucosamine transferase
MADPLHIVFVAGGTSGHVLPLLAIIEAFQVLADERHVELKCSYVGTKEDMGSAAVVTFTGPLTRYEIHAGKLHRQLTLRQFGESARALRGLAEAWKLIGRLQPDAVFAKGGAVSIPVVAAAARKGIPIYGHETDVRPGLANRFAARYARLIFTAYPVKNYSGFDRTQLRFVGQPVRDEFFHPKPGPPIVADKEVPRDLPIVTVLCGSQGSRRVNSLLAPQWARYLKSVSLVHQTGSYEYADLAQRALDLPAELRARLFLVPYLRDGIGTLFHTSALFVGRSGGTIMEAAAAGLPAVLLPLTSAAQDHQRANAAVFEAAGAAVTVDETTVTPSQLADNVLALVKDTRRLSLMSEAIRAFGCPHAANDIAKEVWESLYES